MADSNAPAAPAPPTEEVANLHLDEVTGERVSKTELKKRQKQRQKEAGKAAKAAAAPPKPSSKPKNAAGEEEKELNPNQYYEIRTRHINERTRPMFSSIMAQMAFLRTGIFTDQKSVAQSSRTPRRTHTPTSSRSPTMTPNSLRSSATSRRARPMRPRN